MDPALAGVRDAFLDVSSGFVRVCVLLRKAGRWWLPKDGIRFFPPSPRFGGASSIVGGRVEVCLRRICLWWICSDLFVVRLRSCVFRLDPFDLHSSSAAVVVLVRWFHGALARRLPDCLLQQDLPGSGEGGAKTAARLRLAPVLEVVAKWSTDLDVFFTSCILYTTLTVDE